MSAQVTYASYPHQRLMVAFKCGTGGTAAAHYRKVSQKQALFPELLSIRIAI